MSTFIRVPPKAPPDPPVSVDDAIDRFRRTWAQLPAIARVEALIPMIDFLAGSRGNVVGQIAKLNDTRWPGYVPFLAGQLGRAAACYEAFLTLVVALTDAADAEAREDAERPGTQ